jgi:ribosomal protein S18 acetylase RimI-like enzyme
MSLPFPEEPIDEDFPTPPQRITDKERRRIKLERATEDDFDDLLDMYVDFAPEDRAQGIPPSGEESIMSWLEVVMDDESLNVIAWHRRNAVGHAMLVDDGDGSYEVAIFIVQDYQDAGIGTELLRTTLGAAQKRGIDRVWLSVERWNSPAISLYDKLGFERVDNASFEIEMTIRLDTDRP